jgi:hypothetical protein
MDKLVTIATFDLPSEAQSMKLLLEERGFEVFLADDNVVRVNWFLANALGGAKLQVLESKAQLAAQFVEECRNRAVADKAGKPEVKFDCEECGKPLAFPGIRRGGVETCPHCFEYIDVPE